MARIFVNLLSYTGGKGGMERYTRELYREIGGMPTGHEYIGFASREAMELDLSWFPGEVIASGVSGENRVEWARGELFRVGPAAGRAQAQLVHSPATLGPRKTTMPAVYTMHDMLYFSMPDYMPVPKYNKPVQWMERQAAANAARIMTDSEVSKQEIIKFLKFPGERIDVVYLGATAPVHADAHQGVRREANVFLATGQRLKHKNFERLVEAIGAIPAAERPRLVVTGSFKDDPLISVVERLGLHDWVDLRGWIAQDELESLWLTSTALVVPGIHDGFSLPTLEAMNVGLPVLASNAAIFQEVAGDAAEYFDPLSVDSIAQALRRAAKSPELLSDLARRGHARAEQFTWERTAQQTLGVFDQVLSERG